MKPKTKNLIILLAVVQATLGISLLLLPQIVEALPGSIRFRLNQLPILDPIFAAITTPLPESLPIPSGAVAQNSGTIVVPTLSFQATATPEPPTATLESTSTPAPTAENILPTSLPTETATPTIQPTPTVPLAAVPAAHRLEHLVNTPQSFNNCGPANMTIVVNFWGVEISQADAANYLKPNAEDRNTSPWQMADYINGVADEPESGQTGLRAYARSGGNIGILRTFIANGFPVIIEKGYEPGTAEGWYGHYLTVFGYDDAKQELYSMDTYLGPWDGSGRVDKYKEVEEVWQAFNYTFLVIFQPSQERIVNAILGDLVDDETMWQQAAIHAQAEIEEDPQNGFAWFNLGSSLTELGAATGDGAYYEQGAAAFDQALVLGLPPRMLFYQFRPYLAYLRVGRYQDVITLADATIQVPGGRYVEESFYWKGNALAFTGDIAGARTAYQQGLAVNENSYPIKWALNSLP